MPAETGPISGPDGKVIVQRWTWSTFWWGAAAGVGLTFLVDAVGNTLGRGSRREAGEPDN